MTEMDDPPQKWRSVSVTLNVKAVSGHAVEYFWLIFRHVTFSLSLTINILQLCIRDLRPFLFRWFHILFSFVFILCFAQMQPNWSQTLINLTCPQDFQKSTRSKWQTENHAKRTELLGLATLFNLWIDESTENLWYKWYPIFIKVIHSNLLKLWQV